MIAAEQTLKRRRNVEYLSRRKRETRRTMSKKANASSPTMIGDYLRRIRHEFGMRLDGRPWKQEDLAKLLGVSTIQVAHWEQGLKVPKQRELDYLARCGALIDLDRDPRSITGEPVQTLLSQKGDAAPRGFPAGRSRS